MVNKMLGTKRLKFGVYGHGWRGRGAMGTLPYEDQVKAMRQALVTVNWDHFSHLEGYNSDRLPISMLAGRVHVTTKHPRTPWLPGSENGLVLVENERDVVQVVEEMLGQTPEELLRLGQRANAWVVEKVSDVEAMRFMLSAVSTNVAEPPADPWARLPTYS